MINLHLSIAMDESGSRASHIVERVTILGAGRLTKIRLSGHVDLLIHTEAGCLSPPSENLVPPGHASEPECITKGWRLRY